jgi:hypothetical protein
MAQNFRVGGLASSSITDTFVLWSGTSSGADVRSGFWPVGATAADAGNAYQVTAGKNLYIVKLFYSYGSVHGLCIGYGDTAIGYNSVSNPTSPVNVWGDAVGASSAVSAVFRASGTNENQAILNDIVVGPIPALKYPYLREPQNTSGSVSIWCIEV